MPEDKNILLISYFFPPLGMAASGRPYALFRYLPRFGYRVEVVTIKNIAFYGYDHTLLNDQDEQHLHRTGSLDPARMMHLLGLGAKQFKSTPRSAAGWLYRPDLKRFWNYFALRKTRELLKRKNFAAIITTSPPPSSHIVGLKLKQKYNLPWVADFRDLWLSRPIEEVYRNQSLIRSAQALKSKIVEHADQLVAVNNSIAAYLEPDKSKVEVITNGADPGLEVAWRENSPPKDSFIIGLLGTINELCPIDQLIAGGNRLISAKPALKEKIRIMHIGCTDQAYLDRLLKNYRDKIIFESIGYLPRKRAIAEMSRADVLFISTESTRQFHILPSRLFDLLLSGKPIIGMVPAESDAARLLHDYPGGGTIVDYGGDHIAAVLGEWYDKKIQNLIKTDAILGSHQYTAENTAQKYAALLDRLLS
jgi:glycosyltransferase involved in cell wall biosynthesis